MIRNLQLYKMIVTVNPKHIEHSVWIELNVHPA